MEVDTSPLTADEIKTWFIDTPAVPARTFEFALALGGTVSAGAYTAGALDFLFEALDCFEAARAAGEAPRHSVVLKLIAGTSGGGVNGAIATRALAYDFPHVTGAAPTRAGASGNPFYDTWIGRLRLAQFLATDDVTRRGGLPSVLNHRVIDEAAAQLVRFTSGMPRARTWVGDPLRVIMTLTSLRGVPYRTKFAPELGETYVSHGDHVRFACVYPGRTLATPRPDEQVLTFTADAAQERLWDVFGQFACGTSAFPAGFPPRPLARRTEDYRWRVVFDPASAPNQPELKSLIPDWEAMKESERGTVPETWDFLAVDGGATNNEPIELARTALAGFLGRNPRDPQAANRAVWLIDPFAGQAPLGLSTHASFLAELGGVLTTLIQQTRYDSADILLATDDRVASRFMLAPGDGGVSGRMSGEAALASSGLSAFIGFACPDFMRHDYLLGRANCQKFLRNNFLLRDRNPVFDGWTDAERRHFAHPAWPDYLPILPLLGTAAAPQPVDPWPRGKLDPESYRDAIEARFRVIFEAALSGGVVKDLIGLFGAHLTQRYAADYVIEAMRRYLKSARLD